MKRSFTQALQPEQEEQDIDVSLDSDIWDVIRSYWALLKLVSRWGIIKDALNDTRDTVFCSQDELELRRTDKQLGMRRCCYVAGIESFVWYGPYIAVVCCTDVLSGIGDGRVMNYARLNMYLSWVTEDTQYDQFLSDHLMSMANTGTMVCMTRIDYGDRPPVPLSVESSDPAPAEEENTVVATGAATCCII